MNAFNTEQQAAIAHREGPLLVLAGAGSGKTKVVTERIAQLIESGVPSSQILALTFTNKAAKEMQSRIQKRVGAKVVISTFHSLGALILRESAHHLGYNNGFHIYDPSDCEKLLKDILADLGQKKEKPKQYQEMISQAKNQLESVEDVEKLETGSLFARVYGLYQEKLKACEAFDFDDLLFWVVKLWQQFPEVLEAYQKRWRYLLIDEYQDTNHAQYLIAKLLAGEQQNLCVVGDPDQSIYSWRGANIGNILEFEKDYSNTKTIRLEQNYRSTNTILGAANALIGNNADRLEKQLWSELGQGDPILIFDAENERQEAAYIAQVIEEYHRKGQALNEMAILYRTNAQSRSLEDALLKRRLPYSIVGGLSFYQRKEIKDLLAYLKMIISDADIVSFLRSIQVPKRGLGPTTLKKLVDASMGLNMPIVQLAQLALSDTQASGVKLSKKQVEGLRDYLDLIYRLRRAASEKTLQELVKQTIEDSGYLSFLRADEESFQDRKENVEELIAKAVEWQMLNAEVSLQAFLEELSLKSTLDEASNEEERLWLMTLHNAKGLEFDSVFLVGMEEDLFPHINSKGDALALEEERRLAYVGITRAKKNLLISHCQTRFLWGGWHQMYPSRFLKELPKKFLEHLSSDEAYYF